MRRLLGFAVGVVGIVGFGWLGGLTAEQLTAIIIFASMILATLFFWPYRLAFAFLGLCVLLAAGLLDIPHFIEFAKLDIILFLVAMMTVVG